MNPVNPFFPENRPEAQPTQTEALLDLLEANLNEATVWLTAQGQIQRCNAAFAHLLNGSVVQLIDQPLAQVIELRQAGELLDLATLLNSASTAQIRCELHQKPQSQNPPAQLTVTDIALRLVSSPDILPNGKLLIMQPLSHPPGTTPTVVSRAADFASAAQLPQAQAERYRFAFGSSRIGIWEWNLATGEAFWSAELAAILGIDSSRCCIDYQTWRNCVHPQDIDRVEQCLQQALATGQNYEAEYRVIHADGTLRWVLARGQGIYDAQGQPTYMVGAVVDISDRKRDEVVSRLAEEAWQENQQILDTVMANLPGGVFRCLYSADGNVSFAYVSEAYRDLMQLSPSTISTEPQSFFSRIHPEDAATWQALVTTAQTSLEPSYLEYRVILPTGEEKWLARTARFTWAANGDFVVDGIDIDITNHKQTEAALVASQQFIQTVAEATPGILYVYDLIEQRNIYTNREVGVVLGYSPAEIQQFGANLIAALLHPDDLEQMQAYFGQFSSLADGVKVGWEYRFRHANGCWRWFYSQDIIFARTASGQPRLILGTVIDITDRKQAEEALCAAENQFRRLTENVPGIVYRYVRHANGAGEFTYISPCCQAICGIEAARFLQEPDLVWSIVHPEDRAALQTAITPAAETLSPWCFEFRILTPTGIKWLRATSQAEQQPNGDILWDGVGEDVSDRKQAEAQIQQQTLALQQLNQDLEARVEQRTHELIDSLREKEVLLKEVHHRVKNNLQMIQSLLNLQARSIEEPLVLEVLAESQRRVKAMALVHEKLYQSNNLSRINFAEYVRGLTRDLLQSYVFNTNAVQLSIQIAELELPVDVAIPCGLIINELFSNAIKYAFPNGSSGRITVQFTPSDQPDCYILIVADNGIGLPAALEIQQTKSLGLRLVHALTRQLRGTLEVNRQSGTKFKIQFTKPPHV